MLYYAGKCLLYIVAVAVFIWGVLLMGGRRFLGRRRADCGGRVYILVQWQIFCV